MPLGVLTLAQLDEVVDAYMEFDEFTFDVETLGEFRGDPHRNDVFWISLAGPGRADAIPCGHPIGERCFVEDEFHRFNPTTGKHEEHQVNPATGRLKWVQIPEPFTEPPQQLWVSDVLERLKPLFFSDRRKIGHNVRFDIESVSKYYQKTVPGPYGDTLVAAKLVNENYFGGSPYSLGTCVKREFGFEYEKIGRRGPDKFPYSEAYEYSYLDAKYDWLLWNKLRRQLEDQELMHIFDLEMDVLPSIIDMERTGIRIDTHRLEQLGKEFELELAKLQVDFNLVAEKKINLNAPKQVAELVYDVLGHECTEFTKTGQRSTSKDTLEAFQKDPMIVKLLKHAQLRKLQSSFIVSLGNHLNRGRIHPDFNQVGTVSGRISAREPNIQQIPSRSELGKQIRGVFIAGPGKKLVVADLSQIEMRVLAHFTQDPKLLGAYREGLDLHGITAGRVFGPKFTAIQRTYAKNVNFSVVYGAGPKIIVRKYQVPTLRMATQLLKGFYESYPEVEPWKNHVIRQAHKRYRKGKTPPYVTTILGRKRRLPELLYPNDSMRWGAERQAISVTVSGSAADIFKVIMVDAHKALLAEPYEAHMIMTIHDELVVEVSEEYAEDCLELVTRCMEDVHNPLTGEPFLTVPIVADAKIVDTWEEAK